MDAPVRYAVLWHTDIASPHFDILIETLPGSALATWRSPVWPIVTAVKLTRVKDHRRIYLEFEGQLTERRGRVERVAGGICQLSIGENAVWTIELLTGASPCTLQLKHLGGEAWEASG